MSSHKEPLSREHLCSMLLYSLREGPLGRRTLVHMTGLTESVVRTELEKLEEQKLVRFAKGGTELTPKARQFFGVLFEKVAQVEELSLSELKLDHHNRAAQIRDAAVGVRSWALRDLAIREGATATLFIIHQDQQLSLLGETLPIREHNPRDSLTLEQSFQSTIPGDLIVIVFASTRANAGAGLWRILTEILPVFERTSS